MNADNYDLKARMAKYEKELLQLRKRSTVPTTPTPVVPSVPEPSPEAPPPVAMPINQTMSVQVVDDETEEPICGAVVAVDRRFGNEKEPFFVRFTDQNGVVDDLSLPDLGEAVTYDITAAAPGYFRITMIDFSGTEPILQLRLKALPIY